MKKIFISHAKNDEVIAGAFVDIILQNGLSVPITEIFNSNLDGTKIESGEDWREAIKDNLLSAKVSFLLISPNYKESEVCLCEMGAAWVTSAKVIPLIIEPINYKSVGIILTPLQIEKLLDETSLDRIRDIVQKELAIHPSKIKSDRWTAKKREFIALVKKHISSSPFEKPMDRASFNQLKKDNEGLEITVNVLAEEKQQQDLIIKELQKTKDKVEVSKVMKKIKPSTKFQEFKDLCKAVSSELNNLDSIINGIIFRDYSGKDNVKMDFRDYENEIGNAIADDIITDECYANWSTTKEMRKLKSALDNISGFLDKNEGKDAFISAYEEEYDAPLDIRNKGFWEEVFDVTVRFN